MSLPHPAIKVEYLQEFPQQAQPAGSGRLTHTRLSGGILVIPSPFQGLMGNWPGEDQWLGNPHLCTAGDRGARVQGLQ